MHGGTQPRGQASAQFKHGRYSKHMPTRLAEKYKDATLSDDSNLLQDNIKLRETFIREQLERLDDAPDSVQVWQSIRKALDAGKRAMNNEDYGGVVLAFEEMSRVTDDRLLYYEAMDDIRTNLAEQRKDVQAIANIQYKGESAVNVQQLMAFVGALVHLIQTTVTSRDEQIQLANGIDRLIGVDQRNTVSFE